jgi:hypothetical protein
MLDPTETLNPNPGGEANGANSAMPQGAVAPALIPGLVKLRESIIGWRVVYSFGKNNDEHETFSRSMGLRTMNAPEGGYGLGISKELPDEYQIRAIFSTVLEQDGGFLFNLCYVDAPRAAHGFTNFSEASGNNLVTEWELWLIMENNDYLKRTIFHNGTVIFNFNPANRTFTC